MSNGLLQMVLRSIRPMLGTFKIEVDRDNQRVKIVQGDQVKDMTYEEMVLYIERLINGE